jgi:uncharacterized membrane protein YgdD (TMEM256/DUF423 family)
VNKSKYIVAAFVMALAVMIGAFGAHGLKPHLDAYSLDVYKTANFYHFIHGVALFLVLILQGKTSAKLLNTSYALFIGGLILFSGSLYVLSLKILFPGIPGWMGAITPLGGLLFIGGWVLIALHFF